MIGNEWNRKLRLLLQKTDVAEEIDRLTAHIVEVKRTLQLEQPLGRALDFLMQELNREVNTIARSR